MADITVTCGCGRTMRTVGTAGPGAFACGCGARIRVNVPPELEHCAHPDGCKVGRSPQGVKLGLPLCKDHLRAVADRIEESVTARLEERIRHAELVEVRNEAFLDSWDEKLLPSQQRRAIRIDRVARDLQSLWHVYYMRIGDRIKIGVTGDLPRRMTTLLPDELLAVEPGDRELERQRHLQFAHLRIIGERFRPGGDLMAHIAAVRAEHGEPLLVPGKTIRRPLPGPARDPSAAVVLGEPDATPSQ